MYSRSVEPLKYTYRHICLHMLLFKFQYAMCFSYLISLNVHVRIMCNQDGTNFVY